MRSRIGKILILTVTALFGVAAVATLAPAQQGKGQNDVQNPAQSLYNCGKGNATEQGDPCPDQGDQDGQDPPGVVNPKPKKNAKEAAVQPTEQLQPTEQPKVEEQPRNPKANPKTEELQPVEEQLQPTNVQPKVEEQQPVQPKIEQQPQGKLK